MRLGRHERDILLATGAGWDPFAPGDNASVRAARSRAINKLVRYGLVNRRRKRAGLVRYDIQRLTETGAYKIPIARWGYRHETRLTELGQRIVTHYRDKLTSGARLRWGTWALEAFEAALANPASAWATRDREY